MFLAVVIFDHILAIQWKCNLNIPIYCEPCRWYLYPVSPAMKWLQTMQSLAESATFHLKNAAMASQVTFHSRIRTHLSMKVHKWLIVKYYTIQIIYSIICCYFFQWLRMDKYLHSAQQRSRSCSIASMLLILYCWQLTSALNSYCILKLKYVF